MTRRSPSSLTDQALIEEFEKAAASWGDACLEGDTARTSRLVRRLMSLAEEARIRPDFRPKMIPLLDSRDPGILYNTALSLMTIVPDRARRALEMVARAALPGVSFTARMSLVLMDDGTCTPT